MPELRQDPLTDTWVIIASERSKRPSDFASKKEEKKDSGSCPFCLGNEHMTPPEILAYRERGTPNTDGWSLRVIPNKFAALQNEGQADKDTIGLYEKMHGVGAHEVIVETPDHNRPLGEESEEHIFGILKAWQSRYLDLKKDPRIQYTQLFKNHGAVAGASLSHPHSQLIATPLVPKNVIEELEGIERFYKKEGKCYFCESVEFEKKDRARIVAENNAFIAFCPYAARFPFETWIVPHKHSEYFEESSDEELRSLASILKRTISSLSQALEDPPYNLVVHSAPYRMNEGQRYHWHIEILPRLTIVAGFEWGTGFYINPTPPESAAGYLRQTH
ncbi:MAG TPA: galactose-1-phosphate uridylyltransferase [Clostridia bacterium]|nr:galactose-1-phosphate uridylyltransferase [Clostridia bacterium]